MNTVSWSVSYLWHRILNQLENKLGEVVVAALMDHTEAISVQDNLLVLQEESDFRRELILKKVLPQIRLVVKEEFDFEIEVVLLENDAYLTL